MLLGRGALPTRREWECARRQAGRGAGAVGSRAAVAEIGIDESGACRRRGGGDSEGMAISAQGCF